MHRIKNKKEIIPIISKYKVNLTCYFSAKLLNIEKNQKYDKEIGVTHNRHFIIIKIIIVLFLQTNLTHPI